MNESIISSQKGSVERQSRNYDYSLITRRFIADPQEVIETEDLTLSFLTEWLTSQNLSNFNRNRILDILLQKATAGCKELVTALQWMIIQQKVPLTRDFLVSCYKAHVINNPDTQHMSVVKTHALWHPLMPISLVVQQANSVNAKEATIGQMGMTKKYSQSLEYAKSYMKSVGFPSADSIPEHMIWKVMKWDNWMATRKLASVTS